MWFQFPRTFSPLQSSTFDFHLASTIPCLKQFLSGNLPSSSKTTLAFNNTGKVFHNVIAWSQSNNQLSFDCDAHDARLKIMKRRFNAAQRRQQKWKIRKKPFMKILRWISSVIIIYCLDARQIPAKNWVHWTWKERDQICLKADIRKQDTKSLWRQLWTFLLIKCVA